MRLPFVQVTRFKLTLVGNFSNLAPPPEMVIYAAGLKMIHFQNRFCHHQYSFPSVQAHIDWVRPHSSAK